MSQKTPNMLARVEHKDRTWLRVAYQISKLSTCLRGQVGCVLLSPDGSVAGTGYNGTLPGYPHCTPETCNPSARCLHSRHAERNALDFSRPGVLSTAYITHEPCLRCTQDLLSRGVKRILFHFPYLSMPKEEREARDWHLSMGGVAFRSIEDGGIQ